ncbi:MAG: TetR/AcrR family transcriptional regulator [Ilumatobacter sp.]
MGTDDATPPKRRGRPPASKSEDTLVAILDGGRRLFSERGYAAVTNKDLAAAAGVTTGALYHYVESKLDLYLAVHRDTQVRIYRRFLEAENAGGTFIGKLQGVLDAANDMNEEDPTFARFIGMVRTDLRRHPEVRDKLASADAAREDFFVGLVETGVTTGEVRREDADVMRDVIRVILVGLTEGSMRSPERQRRSVEGVMALMRGDLVTRVDGPETTSVEAQVALPPA